MRTRMTSTRERVATSRRADSWATPVVHRVWAVPRAAAPREWVATESAACTREWVATAWAATAWVATEWVATEWVATEWAARASVARGQREAQAEPSARAAR